MNVIMAIILLRNHFKAKVRKIQKKFTIPNVNML